MNKYLKHIGYVDSTSTNDTYDKFPLIYEYWDNDEHYIKLKQIVHLIKNCKNPARLKKTRSL